MYSNFFMLEDHAQLTLFFQEMGTNHAFCPVAAGIGSNQPATLNQIKPQENG